MDRAMEGGIDDVGCGVLFGLTPYRYDFVGLLMHAEHLEAAKGVGPHTISVPRIRRADDIDPLMFANGIDDATFARIVAVIRIAVPYTGMIISTRESMKAHETVLKLGVSQSPARPAPPSAVTLPRTEEENTSQFDVVFDNRRLIKVINLVIRLRLCSEFLHGLATARDARATDL